MCLYFVCIYVFDTRVYSCVHVCVVLWLVCALYMCVFVCAFVLFTSCPFPSSIVCPVSTLHHKSEMTQQTQRPGQSPFIQQTSHPLLSSSLMTNNCVWGGEGGVAIN